MNKKYANLQHKVVFTAESAVTPVTVYHRLGRLPYVVIPLVNKTNFGGLKISSMNSDEIVFVPESAGTYEVLIF